MDGFDFDNMIEGLPTGELAALDGDIDIGPDGASYVFEIKINGRKGPVGVRGEFGLADSDGTVEGVVELVAYDLTGLEDDADITEGEKIVSPKEYEYIYDRIGELLGFGVDTEEK